MFSVVRYQNERLDVLGGDYRGLSSDGIQPCVCLSVHTTLAEACAQRDSLMGIAASGGEYDGNQ